MIRAYQPGIERTILAAAQESPREIGPIMRTWRNGASYEIAERDVAESIQAWRTGEWYYFAVTPVGSTEFLGRVGLDDIHGSESANVG